MFPGQNNKRAKINVFHYLAKDDASVGDLSWSVSCSVCSAHERWVVEHTCQDISIRVIQYGLILKHETL